MSLGTNKLLYNMPLQTKKKKKNTVSSIFPMLWVLELSDAFLDLFWDKKFMPLRPQTVTYQ